MFRTGQKVVCVDDKPRDNGPSGLTEGYIYTIRGTYLDKRHTVPAVMLEEMKPPASNSRGWFADRFRPLVEKKTDISVFTKLLKTEKVDERV